MNAARQAVGNLAEVAPAKLLLGLEVERAMVGGDHLQVVPDETVLTYTGDTQAKGETVQVSAVLSEDEGVGLAGVPVSFAIGEATVTVTTDVTGTATATLSVPDHGRSQSVAVRCAGTARHAPSMAEATITWGSG